MNIDAFILIGGRSTRLGRDKAFLEFGAETLAARAAETVEAALSPTHVTFVTSSDGQFDQQLLFKLGRPIVADLKPGFGAWSGLHASLSYSRSEWTLVMACDLPFVTPEFLRLVAGQIDNEAEAVIPRQPDGRLQPLCALYRTGKMLEMVDEMLNADRSLPPLTTLSELVQTRVVEPGEFAGLAGSDKFFHNVNTPDDVRTSG